MSSALPTSITSSRQNILVLCLAFISGFIIMAIELLGGRILAPYFGSSIYVWGSIITVFMLSLSIGYLTGGRLSLHNPRLTLYGSFFATAAALLFPLVFWGDAIMEAMFLRIEDPRYGSLVVSMLLFFLPTAVETPHWETDFTVTPSPHHPIGAKGVGESPNVGSVPAFSNAVNDAFAFLKAGHIQMPHDAWRTWEVAERLGLHR